MFVSRSNYNKVGKFPRHCVFVFAFSPHVSFISRPDRSLVGHLLFNPSVQTTLDGESETTADTTVARLVVVTTSLTVTSVAARTGSAVLEARREDRETDGTAVLSPRGSEQTSDSCGSRAAIHGQAIRNASRLSMPMDTLLRNLEGQVIRLLGGAKKRVLLSSQLRVLLLLLLRCLLGQVIQVHRQGVVVLEAALSVRW